MLDPNNVVFWYATVPLILLGIVIFVGICKIGWEVWKVLKPRKRKKHINK